jgi:uncharacterized protein
LTVGQHLLPVWLGGIAMSSPHRPLDRRSGLVLDTHELGRRAGAMKQVVTTVEAPEEIGIAVIGVPAGSPVELDLRLESAVEGVLVTGTAAVQLAGECVRCLVDISDEMEIDVQELFVYPESDATEDEASHLVGDLIDLEPLVRDAVVLDLPFQPLCRDDCQGLCIECGADLNQEPDHHHEAAVDPRWEILTSLDGSGDKTYNIHSPQE